MDLMFGLAMVLGIGPALALLYGVVRKYTYPRVEQPFFSDASLFFLFFIGLIEGSLVFFAMNVFHIASSMIMMILLATVQVMGMVVVMNLKRYRGKSDSVFYGYSLGLGMSSGMATGICYTMAAALEGQPIDASVVLLPVMSVTLGRILGACGTNRGEGIARHRVFEFTMQALMFLVAYNIVFTGMMMGGNDGGFMFYGCMILMIVLSAGYFYYIMKLKLPHIVREVLRMEGNKRNDIPK